MSQSLPPTQPTSEQIAYRPISGWAISGLGVSALCAALVAVLTIMGLIQGAPVFLPIWLLALLAILGLVFSFIGQSHVQNSEGTRVGGKLATVGIWLSAVSGLTYLTYYFVTGFAVQNQADTFLMAKADDSGFFPLLVEGGSQVNAAFLLTLPYNDRSGRPHDEADMNARHNTPGKDNAPGNLAQFKDNPIARVLFGDLAKDAKITPLAVQGWTYEQKSYQVFRHYQIKTKELEAVFNVAVFSTEAEAGKGRKWFVNTNQTSMVKESVAFTPLGKGVYQIRSHASEWLDKWLAGLNQGKAYPAIAEKDRTKWDELPVQGVEPAQLKENVRKLFASADPKRLNGASIAVRPDREFGKWEQVGGKIRIYTHFRFGVPFAKEAVMVQVDGYALLETAAAIDPATLDTNAPAPDFNIVHIVFTHASQFR